MLHEDPRADVGGIFVDPKTDVVRAVSVDYLRNEWTVLDPAIQKDFDYLKTLGDGEINVVSQSHDDKFWVVVLTRSDASPKYYLYDRGAGKATFWFDVRPALAQQKLAVMHPVEIPRARRPEARQLLHAADRSRSDRQRQGRAFRADGAVRARRSVGAR